MFNLVQVVFYTPTNTMQAHSYFKKHRNINFKCASTFAFTMHNSILFNSLHAMTSIQYFTIDDATSVINLKFFRNSKHADFPIVLNLAMLISDVLLYIINQLLLFR